MKKFTLAFVLFVGVVLLSAFVAPILKQFLDFKFRRILSRCLTINLGFYLFFLIRLYGVDIKQFFKNIRLEVVEYPFFLKGFLIGALSLFGIVLSLFLFGVRELQTDLTGLWVMRSLAIGFIAAFLIGVLEGIFFQGILLRLFIRRHVLLGIVALSAIYAALHFFHQGNVWINDPPTFSDSFKVMGGYFEVLMRPKEIWTGFLGLFLFGLSLSLAFLRSGTVLFSAGIHAGCVFVIKFANETTKKVCSHSPLLYGTENFYDGVVPWIFLIVLWVVLFLFYKPVDYKQHVGT